MTPFLKELKKSGKVTAISTSPFRSHLIFNGFEESLFDQTQVLDTAVDRIRHTANFKRKFDVIFLDQFAADRKNIILAHTNGKKILAAHIPDRLPKTFTSRITSTESEAQIHEASRYMRNVIPEFSDAELNASLFRLRPKETHSISERPYITIQPGSGNNRAPWKTWPLDRWISVIEYILENYPLLNVVVMGDDSETNISERLPINPNVINAIGVTSMEEVPGVISKAKVHLGNDSALLHVAGCVGTETISVWGGSDPGFYGWSKIDPEAHQEVYLNPACGPCSRWLLPNLDRVELPNLCPDFKCLTNISVEAVTKHIDQKLQR